mmetsp:Transcript_2341/g.5045  ORF Transcript_2341/g.5045 Transcript_2341/m.5045 type:complete len:325 (+) Transcript_2341:278-1252(+)|eukprot:CAMPEP_0171345506 /NCGR_PEP_ID=MMETSP0878-20121228/21782_1 /TAXON_ID=67004 /ORGANISM="Thalassiosira weissflogii, Strain CCMP1336" /LENGTH=324 /DNA_ID=CAMNT_0011848929 /DNA_START=258 /DNA_END=1232 /DNA_ORIENTATION=+
MRSFRASGILDEGNDVDPSFAMTNDRERLLPRSVVASKSSTATTTITENQPHRQARGNIRNITNTISNVRGRLLGKPPKYPRSPTQNSMQQKETKHSRNNYTIQTKGNYENLQQSPTQPSNVLPQSSSSASLKSQPHSSINNSPQSIPEQIRPRTTPPNKILKEQTNFETSYREHEYDHDYDDYHYSFCNVCCDEDGCNFQLSRHCNEGMKNLCTIAIWAMLVFAIVNRFLMHMGMFYARGRSVGRVRNGVVDGVGREFGAGMGGSENDSGKRNVEVGGSSRVDFDTDNGSGGKRLLDEEIVVGANVGTFSGKDGDMRGVHDIF